MSIRNHIPNTVEASLDARLAPFRGPATALEDLDVEVSRAVSPQQDRKLRLSLINDLKLLFAALGAGGRVVPLGDNGRTARLLSEYAASLRQH
jgi:acetylornithine deacetylase/succinyl-diaminopimelate desuccinylase-like protein